MKKLVSVVAVVFFYFNSQVEHPGKAVVDELIARGIAEDERPAGPVIVKIDELLGLAKEKYRTLVVLRSDNTALYATEDLALAIKKFEDYPRLSRSFYVVDVRQSLHFQQVFKTLEIAAYPWAPCCQHIPYELVILPGNVVMSSREGNIVLLEDLIREAIPAPTRSWKRRILDGALVGRKSRAQWLIAAARLTFNGMRARLC